MNTTRPRHIFRHHGRRRGYRPPVVGAAPPPAPRFERCIEARAPTPHDQPRRRRDDQGRALWRGQRDTWLLTQMLHQ
jgi:hypothetical protein